MSVLARRFGVLIPLFGLLACADLIAPVVENSSTCSADSDCRPTFFCLGDPGAKRCLRSGTARCGDGEVQGVEACDDGNREDDDACRNNCLLAACGDGLLRIDIEKGAKDFEACDDGNTDDSDQCTATCQTARFGDGLRRVVETPDGALPEACDDGNASDGDGCSSDCRIERCGDGERVGIEACDDGNDDQGDACLSDCVLARCGDGHHYRAEEECDDGNDNDLDACISGCRLARCGDGVLRAGLQAGEPGFESCDDGNLEGGDGCAPNCLIEACGNQRLDQGEGCDDGNLFALDACSATCAPARCGDGLARVDLTPEAGEAYEACDDGNEDDDDLCTTACRWNFDLVDLGEVGGVGPERVYVVGSPDDEPGRRAAREGQIHVRFSRAFAIGRTEVIQAQFEAVMGYNPSYFRAGNLPVERVSWFDAVAFANAASRANGLPTCYIIEDNAATMVEAGLGCLGYRLPTDAEWEVAARADSCRPYAGCDALDDLAWHPGNSEGTTHPGAQKEPNAWGLYDMTGNVSEWVWDTPLSGGGEGARQLANEAVVVDPMGAQDPEETYRCFRGGAYRSRTTSMLRVSYRDLFGARVTQNWLGFRLARTLR